MTRTRTAVLDVLGTLFDLEPVRSSFVELGAPAPALEAWFQRILHEAATVTLIESYRPFRELASSALRTTLAQLGMDASRKEPLEALAELEPYPDASEALARLRSAGVSVVALTNGSRESTMRLLQRGGLAGHVEKVFSCDDVERFKPHAAPYRLALERVDVPATMVAAHGWDVVGARAAGLDAIWIERQEREWPFPLDPPERVRDLAAAADRILEPHGLN